MDFEIIKKLLKKEKTRLVIIEDGRPTMVILPIEEYLGMETSSNPGLQQEKILLPEESNEKKEEKRGLTIDDLPL